MRCALRGGTFVVLFGRALGLNGLRLLRFDASSRFRDRRTLLRSFFFRATTLRLGRLFANDADSYRYLAESIRKHPDQDTLKGMMLGAGFGHVEVRNLSNGIVAIHRAYKL